MRTKGDDMVKLLEIKCCKDCHWLSEGTVRNACGYSANLLLIEHDDLGDIPAKCPLPELDDYISKNR